MYSSSNKLTGAKAFAACVSSSTRRSLCSWTRPCVTGTPPRNNTCQQQQQRRSFVNSSVYRAADSYLSSNVNDLFSLKDRVVVITGGGRGIGLALAFAVAEAGGQVALIDLLESPHEHYEKLQELCPNLRYYKSDVTSYEILQSTFNEIASDFGRIDGMYVVSLPCTIESVADQSQHHCGRCLPRSAIPGKKPRVCQALLRHQCARNLLQHTARSEADGEAASSRGPFKCGLNCHDRFDSSSPSISRAVH
jgi:hypothetical protein